MENFVWYVFLLKDELKVGVKTMEWVEQTSGKYSIYNLNNDMSFGFVLLFWFKNSLD